MPRLFVRAVFRRPLPVTSTFTPLAAFFPAVTLTEIVACLPSALIIFGVTTSARQCSTGFVGFVGFGVGGVSGSGTVVVAESVLSAGFASAPPLPVTV